MYELNLKIDLDKLTEDERNIFMSLVEKTQKDEQVLKNGDDIFYIAIDGEIEEGTYRETSDLDKRMIEFGNIYRTEEEAEAFSRWLKIRRRLEKFAKENNECELSWKNTQKNKYYIYYYYNQGRISISSVCFDICDDVYFSSREIARKAIEFIGEENLKRDYFRVKE